ncbi:hypothetical protein BN1708_006582, partial [Verticillium longisporum]
MDNNLWTRRTNSGKLSLSTPSHGNSTSTGGDSARNGSGSFSKRFGGATSSQGKNDPFSATAATTPGGSSLASPTTGASNAFGLGSGAFASFGSAKTPKTPGNPFELAMGKAPASKTPGADGKAPSMASIAETGSSANFRTGQGSQTSSARGSSEVARPQAGLKVHPLKYEWVTWCRP